MKKILICFLCITIAILGIINFNMGDTNNVKTTIENLNEHDKKDILKVFTIIKRDFHTFNFRDCKLISLNYDGKKMKDMEEEAKSESKANEAIVITFIFKTGNNPEKVFNTNSEYEYSATFVKNNNKWQKINWGQG